MSVQTVVGQQLSFEVVDPNNDEEVTPEPLISTFTLSGDLATRHHELYQKKHVIVQLIDPVGGMVLARVKAMVVQIAFPVHQADGTGQEWVERKHKLKVIENIETLPETTVRDTLRDFSFSVVQ
ncbi:MAG TPA: hypothetical protein VG265_16585 [Gaiellaceae bacterium]|nr:hypothetical protein [Gaiellaceae bacterium]